MKKTPVLTRKTRVKNYPAWIRTMNERSKIFSVTITLRGIDFPTLIAADELLSRERTTGKGSLPRTADRTNHVIERI